MNIMHKLILQIIISEIVDEVNILLGIIADCRGNSDLKIMNLECIHVILKHFNQYFHVYGL